MSSTVLPALEVDPSVAEEVASEDSNITIQGRWFLSFSEVHTEQAFWESRAHALLARTRKLFIIFSVIFLINNVIAGVVAGCGGNFSRCISAESDEVSRAFSQELVAPFGIAIPRLMLFLVATGLLWTSWGKKHVISLAARVFCRISRPRACRIMTPISCTAHSPLLCRSSWEASSSQRSSWILQSGNGSRALGHRSLVML